MQGVTIALLRPDENLFPYKVFIGSERWNIWVFIGLGFKNCPSIFIVKPTI
jgi:hypothetical protein